MQPATHADAQMRHPPGARGGFTIRGAVEWSGLSRSALYRAAGEGKLILRKAGRTTIVDGSSLAEFVQSLPVVRILPSHKAT